MAGTNNPKRKATGEPPDNSRTSKRGRSSHDDSESSTENPIAIEPDEAEVQQPTNPTTGQTKKARWEQKFYGKTPEEILRELFAGSLLTSELTRYNIKFSKSILGTTPNAANWLLCMSTSKSHISTSLLVNMSLFARSMYSFTPLYADY
jgi:hypothetical protein